MVFLRCIWFLRRLAEKRLKTLQAPHILKDFKIVESRSFRSLLCIIRYPAGGIGRKQIEVKRLIQELNIYPPLKNPMGLKSAFVWDKCS